MDTSALGLLKHNFEIIMRNSGNSWEEEQSQSQKQGGGVPELFITSRDSQSQILSLGSSFSTLEGASNKRKGQHWPSENRHG